MRDSGGPQSMRRGHRSRCVPIITRSSRDFRNDNEGLREPRYRGSVPASKVARDRDDSGLLAKIPSRVTICNTRKHSMTFGVAHIQPVVALVAGILILIMPRLLNYIIAIYLIFVGIVGLGIIR
jgi:hypothetical protein